MGYQKKRKELGSMKGNAMTGNSLEASQGEGTRGWPWMTSSIAEKIRASSKRKETNKKEEEEEKKESDMKLRRMREKVEEKVRETGADPARMGRMHLESPSISFLHPPLAPPPFSGPRNQNESNQRVKEMKIKKESKKNFRIAHPSLVTTYGNFQLVV